jgi:hypothetical protein
MLDLRAGAHAPWSALRLCSAFYFPFFRSRIMSAYQVADPNVTPKLAQADAQAVTVVHGTDPIGQGELVMTETRIDITGSYQWPPDAPAEVRFVFTFQILSSSTCNVNADWPGLLPKEIGPVEAGFIMLLLEARPQFLVFLPDGGNMTITYVGPFGQPEIVTALQVAVGGPNGEYSQMLSFRYDYGRS